MASLGFKRDSKCLKYKRIDGMRQWCYVMLYNELYVLFDKKDWIHSKDRKDYGIDNEAEESPTPISKSKAEKITSPISDFLKPVFKKVPLPISSKPDHLKLNTNTSVSEPECIQEPESFGIPSPSSISIKS